MKPVVSLHLSRISHGRLWRSRGPAVQSAGGLAAIFVQLHSEAAHPPTASGSAGFVDCVCGWKNSPQTVTVLAAVILEGVHSFLCSLLLILVMCTLGRHCACTMDVCWLVFVRLHREYDFVGGVLCCIWMEYYNDINEVAFTADCFPLPKVRPFTAKNCSFSNLWGPGLWR